MFRIPALHGARQELAVVEPSVTSASPGEDVKMKDGKWKKMEDGRRKTALFRWLPAELNTARECHPERTGSLATAGFAVARVE
jgi:hypothetical protein